MNKCDVCPRRDSDSPCVFADADHPPGCERIRQGRADFVALVLGVAPTPPPPTFFGKVISFAGAALNHVAHGMPTVDDAEKARRLAICGRCEHHRPESGTCGRCGCVLALKASWALEKCPADPPRW